MYNRVSRSRTASVPHALPINEMLNNSTGTTQWEKQKGTRREMEKPKITEDTTYGINQELQFSTKNWMSLSWQMETDESAPRRDQTHVNLLFPH